MGDIWAAIRGHYAHFNDQIMAERPNEWAIDAYAWEPTGIRMTPIERMFWGDIRDANVVMYPQYPVGRFFVDFGNPVAKVAIECDGKAFHLDKAKDQARDRALADMGWTVYRITGADCIKDFDEETREPSPARKLVDLIADRHPVKRGKTYRGVSPESASKSNIDT